VRARAHEQGGIAVDLIVEQEITADVAFAAIRPEGVIAQPARSCVLSGSRTRAEPPRRLPLDWQARRDKEAPGR
jgi:hypothetical protein